MTSLLDRLLFVLPPLSRASLVRGGLYLLFGATLYGLFLGLLFGQEQLLAFLNLRLQNLPGVRVEISRPETSFFPPAVSVDALSVGPRSSSSGLVLRRVRVRPTLFPPGLHLSAHLGSGSLDITAAPAALWNPQQLDVRVQGTGVPFEEILLAAGVASPLVQLRGGRLDGVVEARLPLGGGLPSDGKASLTLRGLRLEHQLPMLIPPRLEGLSGTLELDLRQNRLELRRADLRNDLLICTLQGQADLLPQDPLGSRMDMFSTLRIPLEQVQQELVPQRTLNALKNTGEVRLRIRETFRRPSLDVQP